MKKINSFTILKITTLILFTTFTGCDTPSNTPVIPVTPVTPTNPETPTSPSTPSNPTTPTSPQSPTNTPELRVLRILPATHTLNLNNPTGVV